MALIENIPHKTLNNSMRCVNNLFYNFCDGN